MGKKLRGAALRAKKRAREALDELQEHQAERAVSKTVTTQPDADLFVLDTTGGIIPPHQAVPKKKKAKTSPVASAKEEEQIQKLLQKYDKETLIKRAEEGRKLQGQLHKRSLRGKTKATFDLWQDESDNDNMKVVLPKITNTTSTKALTGIESAHVMIQARRKGGGSKKQQQSKVVKVEVAHAGQSYHPDPVAHKTTIANAVAVEVAREEAVKEKETPLAKGMSKETRDLLVGSDSESSEDEEVERDNDDTPVGTLPKRNDKKTRAQRNKEKRLRQEKAVHEKRKREKKLMNQVGEIPRFNKVLKRKEREKQQRKEKEQSIVPLGRDLHQKLSRQDPIKAPTFPVALPSEVAASSLRTIKPKGSLATDRLASLIDRNFAPKPTNNPSHVRNKRRKKSVKGKQNNEGVGPGFVVKGWQQACRSSYIIKENNTFWNIGDAS